MFVSKIRILFSLAVIIILLLPFSVAGAQEEPPQGPLYRVESGDSLWSIAQRFGVSITELTEANEIQNPNQLALGSELVIPGLEGVNGILVTAVVPFGETLRSLSRQYNLAEDVLARLNRVVHPMELYAGSNLILLEELLNQPGKQRDTLAAGESLLEMASVRGQNPWTLVLDNQLPGTWAALPGDVLLFSGETTAGPAGLPDGITSIEFNPEQIGQGRTAVLHVSGESVVSLSGSLVDHTFDFFQKDGHWVALQGIYALVEAGLYPLEVSGQLDDGREFAFSQRVLVRSSNYPFDPPLVVDPSTVDPAVTEPENEQLLALTSVAGEERLWEGQFASPVDELYKDCWPSRFGNRRSYNGSAYDFFHSGLDFCGSPGDKIFAPSAGQVVFAGPLTVRGNTTVIDHGWGVYTVYMHQSEIKVQLGDRVVKGQEIGLVGGTGRVTGPHLHWEVWVNGFQVDPIDWLENPYP